MDYGRELYYVIGQSRNWNGISEVFILVYCRRYGELSWKLTISGSSRPVLVKLENPVSTKLEPGRIRDVEFTVISKTLGKELSSVQITGEGFDSGHSL